MSKKLEDGPERSNNFWASASGENEITLHLPVQVDFSRAQEFKQSMLAQLEAEQTERLILDARFAQQTDSTTLAIALGALKQARVMNKELMLGGPLPEPLQQMLERSPLAGILRVINLNEQEDFDI